MCSWTRVSSWNIEMIVMMVARKRMMKIITLIVVEMIVHNDVDNLIIVHDDVENLIHAKSKLRHRRLEHFSHPFRKIISLGDSKVNYVTA